jgi:hypothetical protein
MLQRLQKDKFRFSEQKIEFNQDDVFGVRTDNKGKVVPILKWQTQCYNPADLNQPATPSSNGPSAAREKPEFSGVGKVEWEK